MCLLTTGVILKDRYRIERELSQNVYLATDTHNADKLSAIKHIKLAAQKNGSRKQAGYYFDREMASLAKTSETCNIIPKVIDYFRYPDRYGSFYLVSEYIAGKSIAEEISDDRIMSELSTIGLIKQILLKLQKLHDLALIHDALEPSQIIRKDSDLDLVFCYYGSIKNKFWDISNDEILNDTNIAGKSININIRFPFCYRSPESLAQRPSFSSDIYSVGCIGIQSLINVPLSDVVDDPITGRYQWEIHCNHVDDNLIRILSKMTEISARYRYQTISEVLEDINLVI